MGVVSTTFVPKPKSNSRDLVPLSGALPRAVIPAMQQQDVMEISGVVVEPDWFSSLGGGTGLGNAENINMGMGMGIGMFLV